MRTVTWDLTGLLTFETPLFRYKVCNQRVEFIKADAEAVRREFPACERLRLLGAILSN